VSREVVAKKLARLNALAASTSPHLDDQHCLTGLLQQTSGLVLPSSHLTIHEQSLEYLVHAEEPYMRTRSWIVRTQCPHVEVHQGDYIYCIHHRSERDS